MDIGGLCKTVNDVAGAMVSLLNRLAATVRMVELMASNGLLPQSIALPLVRTVVEGIRPDLVEVYRLINELRAMCSEVSGSGSVVGDAGSGSEKKGGGYSEG